MRKLISNVNMCVPIIIMMKIGQQVPPTLFGAAICSSFCLVPWEDEPSELHQDRFNLKEYINNFQQWQLVRNHQFKPGVKSVIEKLSPFVI